MENLIEPPMDKSCHNDMPKHASQLAMAASPVEKLTLVLPSRLASVLSLVGVVIMITPEGVR